MPTTTNQQFKITVPITRCSKRTNADGVEKYVVEGMASNTNLDLTGERMAESAIQSIATSLATHQVAFKNEHGDEWDAEFGEVTALTATGDHQLMMEAELDPDHYRTKTLVKALERGKALGLSIGGIVIDAASEWVDELKRAVKTYKDILLEEISVTGSPAVSDTWLTNSTKSVKWRDMDKLTEHAVDKTDETTTETTDAPEAEAVATTAEEATTTASMNNLELMFYDKMGPKAKFLSGQMANHDGSLVVLSKYVRPNLNATGVYDGVTITKSIIICVYLPAFLSGDCQEVNLEPDRHPDCGQDALIARERVACDSRYAGEPVVAVGYNVACAASYLGAATRP